MNQFCFFYEEISCAIHNAMSEAPFSTKLLDDALELQKKENEIKRLQKIKEVFSALEALAKRFRFDGATLFGSLTRPGCFDPQSDFDIAIEGLSSEDFISALSFLSSQLRRDVDLVRLEDFQWKDRIIREGISWKKQKQQS